MRKDQVVTDEVKTSILAIALDDEMFERVSPILRREEMRVSRVGQAAEGLAVARRQRNDLVICRYPLPDLKLREFVAALRDGSSASRACSLMLLTIPEMTTEARDGAIGGPYLVFSGQEPIGTLGEGAAHLLKVAPRCSPRLRTRLRASIDEGRQPLEGWVVNISASGMLVTEVPMLPVGTECEFELELPNGRFVRGRARVVRHARPRRERVTGFALRFITFDEGCADLLRSWCETHSSPK